MVEFHFDCYDYHSGQNYCRLFATVDSVAAGRMDISLFQGKTYIDMIDVKPEFRKQGIASGMIEYLIEHENIPYGDIEWGMTTPEGTELKKKMDLKFGSLLALADRLQRIAKNIGGAGRV